MQKIKVFFIRVKTRAEKKKHLFKNKESTLENRNTGTEMFNSQRVFAARFTWYANTNTSRVLTPAAFLSCKCDR